MIAATNRFFKSGISKDDIVATFSGVRPLYDELGLLEYEVAPSDFEIDWAEITKPLESSDQVKAESDDMLAEILKAQEAANS